jgi:ABC-type amino acid transport substrate-binding protein
MKICGQPYKPPHILFWNLRSTSGFPVLSSQKNTSMMSGFSAALLNLFCDEGMNALKSCTPWSLLLKSLDNERYSILGNKLEEIVQ